MKRREQILLLLFLSLGGFVLTYQLWQVFSSRLQALQEREHALELRKVETEIYLERRDFWLARLEWLEETQPQIPRADQVDNQLVNLAQASKLPAVSTENLKLLDPVETPFYRQAGIAFTARGRLPDLFAWLHGLQKPDQFYAIRRLKVVPDKSEPDKVVCDVELLRWYAP